MIATTEEALRDLFRDAILDMTPRLTYEGAEEWKYYEKEVGGPSRTRRFRIIFGDPELRTGGAMAGHVFEHEIEVRIRTDYAGNHAETNLISIDDFLQLRDVLSGLKASDNGLVVVTPVNRRIRDSFTESSDVTQVDHTFRCRYMRSIRP